jgi:hypothetical protein
VIPILGKAPHPPKGEGLKIVLQAIDNQKGKAKGIHLNFIINLLSPSKKTEQNQQKHIKTIKQNVFFCFPLF